MKTKFLLVTLLLCSLLNSTFAQQKVEDRKAQYYADGDSLKEYLYRSTKYPIDAQDSNIQGQVIIEFTVDKCGNLKDFKPLKEFDRRCTDSAIEALKSSPKWLPEIKKGKAVKSRNTVIIYFKLIGSDTKIDIEPGENNIVVYGYGTRKRKIPTIGI